MNTKTNITALAARPLDCGRFTRVDVVAAASRLLSAALTVRPAWHSCPMVLPAMSSSKSEKSAPSGAVPAGYAFPVIVAALLPFALGYLLSYLFRAVNAVVAPDLVAELQLNATQLGLMTAAYLFAFSLFQVPLGVLLDRFGPRRVQAALLVVAAIGALLFSVGQTATSLTLARALIGLGFAGGLMSGFKAVVLFVPEQRRGFASSCVMSLGALGLIIATAPMEAAVARYGWRSAFVGLACATALVAAIVFFVVPKQHATSAALPWREQARSIWSIIRDPAFLRLAPLLGISAGTHIAIQTLWAGPWWRDIGGLDRAGVAHELMLMAMAFFVGILGTGWVADWFVRRGVSILDVLLGFMVAFFAAQALIILDALRHPAWLLFGMLGQVAVLAFPWFSTYFGVARSGRANGAMNLVIFGLAFISQSLIGWIIDLYPRTATGGFPIEAYRAGFGTFLVLELLGLLWFLPARRRLSTAKAVA
jgi:predicted MFS family arabinose efflux permease